MINLVERIDRRFYKRFSRNWDDQLFREHILRHLGPDKAVLDLGAGAGIVEAMDFKGLARSVCGVDIDPRVTRNLMLDEGRVADAGSIPWPDASFDVVFADNVAEHLEQPLAVFNEVNRVLKPAGVFLIKTPNKMHYMPAIARVTPHWFHQFINRLRGRAEVDTFPTRYKANTARDLRDLAARSGFAVEAIELIEGRPEYLRISWPTYLLGVAYERLVNGSDLLAGLRILLVAELRKL